MSRVLCRVAELAEGEARGFGPFNGGREKAFVVRKGERVYAYWDACPHYGDTPMAFRTNAYLNAARDRIVCASHGAEFEIETGRCVLGAALGKSLRPAPIEATPSGEIIIKS
jgi:nitrite reductase/ring-hydroxylating ferredoxin subunit